LNNRSSWQCAFFDENSKIYIDKFKLTGVITTKDKKKHILSQVNRRTDSSGIVLYNSYAGDTIPIVTRRSINSALADALADSTYSDMTEEGFDTLEFKQFLLNKQRDSSKDNSFRKVRLEYLAKPAVNMNIPCRVLSIDTGIVSVPKNGCVLTIGEDVDSSFFIKEFDIINLRYSTDKYHDIIFTGGLCGVPRLMAGGASRFEGQQKRGRGRFKYKELPRTGLGTSKDGKTLYLISASSSSDKYGIKGCTLENFAYAMKRLRIYDAINLDGGGSTVMVINGKGVMSCAECSRKISVGVGVARRKGK
jgi:hypothetical protein